MSFVVPARFCGPPESGNGGWVSGHLAQLVPTTPERPAVRVRLCTPPPLERPMRVRTGPDGARDLLDGELLVASAAPATPPCRDDLAPPVRYPRALEAGAAYAGLTEHPFPTCFSCGTGRGSEALRLRPGRVGEAGVHAAAWLPTEVSPEIVWAALDCPGAWALGVGGRPMVLGTMTALVLALPESHREHVVMAWGLGGEGRAFRCGTALYAGEQLLASAQATWVTVDPAAVRPAGRPS